MSSSSIVLGLHVGCRATVFRLSGADAPLRRAREGAHASTHGGSSSGSGSGSLVKRCNVLIVIVIIAAHIFIAALTDTVCGGGGESECQQAGWIADSICLACRLKFVWPGLACAAARASERAPRGLRTFQTTMQVAILHVLGCLRFRLH